jgi:hypothetical protein
VNFLKKFDAVYVINLDNRQDRLMSFVNEMPFGMSEYIIRFPAINVPENGAEGCIQSHLAIVKIAKEKGYRKILIFEDDAQPYSKNLANYQAVGSDIDNLQWDVYYLGYNSHEKLNKVTDNSLRAKEIFSTHAIAYNETFYDKFISAYESGEIKILDVWLRYTIQPTMNCLASYPLLFTQRSGYSDIEKMTVSYDFIVDRYHQNTSHLSEK